MGKAKTDKEKLAIRDIEIRVLKGFINRLSLNVDEYNRTEKDLHKQVAKVNAELRDQIAYITNLEVKLFKLEALNIHLRDKLRACLAKKNKKALKKTNTKNTQ